jgi:hypothetical protein
MEIRASVIFPVCRILRFCRQCDAIPVATAVPLDSKGGVRVASLAIPEMSRNKDSSVTLIIQRVASRESAPKTCVFNSHELLVSELLSTFSLYPSLRIDINYYNIIINYYSQFIRRMFPVC